MKPSQHCQLYKDVKTKEFLCSLLFRLDQGNFLLLESFVGTFSNKIEATNE